MPKKAVFPVTTPFVNSSLIMKTDPNTIKNGISRKIFMQIVRIFFISLLLKTGSNEASVYTGLPNTRYE
jgi:hypothetical protein